MDCVLRCENCVCRRENEKFKLEKLECALIHEATRNAFITYLRERSNELCVTLVECFYKIHECLEKRTNPYTCIIYVSDLNSEEYLFNEAQGIKLDSACNKSYFPNDEEARKFLKDNVHNWIMDDLFSTQLFDHFKASVTRKQTLRQCTF